MLSDWASLFSQIKSKEYAQKLHTFLDDEYAKYTIYPPRHLIYNSF